MPNHLATETSPYLLQHATNPVDWYPWGEAALTKAKAEDKPIFLSIGYAACHWCHVMAHESFEDEATAQFMNERFVNIKVDREERPDLDSIYMNAVVGLTGSGGWPMSVFLTPEGKPFYGGTYFPPTPRYGMPSFREVLRAVSEAWRGRRDESSKSSENIAAYLRQASEFADTPNAGPRSRRHVGESDAEHRPHIRSHPRRLGQRPQISAAHGAGVSPAPLRSTAGRILRAYDRSNVDRDGARRHVRSTRRRVSSLFHRCPLAGATLREDAVRQQPTRARLSARLAGAGQS